MIRAFVADWWWACRWTGAYVLGTGLVLGAAVAYYACRDRWRDWRTPRCRWCFVPLTWTNHRTWMGLPVTGHRHICDVCIRAWDCRRRRLPREVMG